MHFIAFLMFVALLLEIIGGIFALFTIVAPWRFATAIYDIIRAPSFSDSRWSRLRAVSLVLLMTLLDAISFIPLFFISITIYRLPIVISGWKKVAWDPTPNNPGWLKQPGGRIITPTEMHPFFRLMNTLDFHAVIWSQFGSWMIDVMLGFASIAMILAPWRFVFAILELRKIWVDPAYQDDFKRLSKRRRVWARQIVLAVLDFSMIPFLMVLLACAWRFTALIYSVVDVNKGANPCTRKNLRGYGLILQQVGLLVMDVFVLIPAFIVLVTVYRLGDYVAKIKSKDAFNTKRLKVVTRGLILHQYLYYAFFNIMYDLLAIFMFVLCLVTIIPIVFLATDFSQRDRAWFSWKHLRKHTVIWGLLTVPLWLSSPVLVRGCVRLLLLPLILRRARVGFKFPDDSIQRWAAVVFQICLFASASQNILALCLKGLG